MFSSAYGAPEWAAAFADDPEGAKRKLVPVRAAECKPEGLLRSIVHIDLIALDEENARAALLDGVAEGRAKPASKPGFPGGKSASRAPTFPGASGSTVDQASTGRYMPRVKKDHTDLEKRRFVKDTFEIIRGGFERHSATARLDAREPHHWAWCGSCCIRGAVTI